MEASKEFKRFFFDTVMSSRERYRSDAEVIDYVLYDTVSLEFNEKTFFNRPIGNAGKTKIDTNMVDANQLPDPQAFWLQGISLCIVGPEADHLIDPGVLQLHIGNKAYVTIPTALALRSHLLQQYDSSKVMYTLKTELGIAPRIGFGVDVTLWYSQKIKVRAELHGYLIRPVQ